LETFLTVLEETDVQKSLRRALWAGAVVVASTAMIPTVQASAATACAPAWSSTATYVQGNSASQNGHNYTAKWWTQNESPATHSAQWDVWADGGTCGGGTTTPPTTPPTTAPTTTPPTGGTPGKNVVGYFAEWGVYARQYFVKNLVTSGSASKLTHILYAFGNTTGGQCSIGDSYAD
jgi:chitinase